MTANNVPITKVTAAAFAGALVTVFVWLMNAYAGVEFPAEVVAAITTVVMAGVNYLVPLFETEVTVPESLVGELEDLERQVAEHNGHSTTPAD